MDRRSRRIKNDEAIMHNVFRKPTLQKAAKSNFVTSYDQITNDTNTGICDIVDEKFGTVGVGGYNACYTALEDCKINPSACSEALVWQKYSEALNQGYSADFSTFKRQSSIAGYLTNIGAIIQGFFRNRNQQPTTDLPETQPKSNKGLLIGLGVAGVLVVGALVYFIVKPQKK